MEIHMQTNIADKALIITPLHTTRQVLGQGNRHQTNWRYILEILAVADTCHCAQLVFVQYLIDLMARSLRTRVRNTPSAIFIGTDTERTCLRAVYRFLRFSRYSESNEDHDVLFNGRR